MLDDVRAQHIRRILRRQSRHYPELNRRPGYRELLHICHAEGVTVVRDERLPTAGALVYCLDSWTLFLSSKLAFSLVPATMVHELAHLWCHTGSEVYTTSIEDDPREEEADYFVSLVYGPHYLVCPVAELLPDELGRFLPARL